MVKILTILCGGLGASQLGGIRDVVDDAGIATWEPAAGLNQYKHDLAAEAVAAVPDATAFIVVGHSLGCDTAIAAAEALAESMPVALLVLIEPVIFGAQGAQKHVPHVPCLWFRATFPIDFPPADVLDVPRIDVPGTDHNSICHAPDVVNRIVARITEIALSMSIAAAGVAQ